MADEALFLLLHNEMVSGVYKSAEQGEVVSAATYSGILRDAHRDLAGCTLDLRDAPWDPAGCTPRPCGTLPFFSRPAAADAH